MASKKQNEQTDKMEIYNPVKKLAPLSSYRVCLLWCLNLWAKRNKKPCSPAHRLGEQQKEFCFTAGDFCKELLIRRLPFPGDGEIHMKIMVALPKSFRDLVTRLGSASQLTKDSELLSPPGTLLMSAAASHSLAGSPSPNRKEACNLP